MSDHLPTLGELLDHLSKELGSLPTTPATLVPDLVIANLAMDAAEQADIVQRHENPNTNRALWANARAAFEASLEFLYIVANPKEYLLRGCSARCFEILEGEKLQRRFFAADAAIGASPTGEPQHTEDIILADASEWESFAPGSGGTLRQAFEAVQAKVARNEKHWSGLSATDIYRTIERELALDPGTAAAVSAFVGVASAQAHPRSRSLHRQVQVHPDTGRLSLSPSSDDIESVLLLTRLALVLVGKGVEARRAMATAV